MAWCESKVVQGLLGYKLKEATCAEHVQAQRNMHEVARRTSALHVICRVVQLSRSASGRWPAEVCCVRNAEYARACLCVQGSAVGLSMLLHQQPLQGVSLTS